MCQDIIDTPGLRTGGVLFFRLAAAGWVDAEVGEDFAGAVFDGGDVGVPDEQDDAFVFVGAAYAKTVNDVSKWSPLSTGPPAFKGFCPWAGASFPGRQRLGICLLSLGPSADFRTGVPVQSKAVGCADEHQRRHSKERPFVNPHVIGTEQM